MHYIITFETQTFDLDAEDENPINPIKGKSVGDWLTPLLETGGIQCSEIEPEDWGWYLDTCHNDQNYMIGFIALPDQKQTEPPEIIIQVVKERKFKDRVFGKNKMTEDDPLLRRIKSLIDGIPDARKIEVLTSA